MPGSNPGPLGLRYMSVAGEHFTNYTTPQIVDDKDTNKKYAAIIDNFANLGKRTEQPFLAAAPLE